MYPFSHARTSSVHDPLTLTFPNINNASQSPCMILLPPPAEIPMRRSHTERSLHIGPPAPHPPMPLPPPPPSLSPNSAAPAAPPPTPASGGAFGEVADKEDDSAQSEAQYAYLNPHHQPPRSNLCLSLRLLQYLSHSLHLCMCCTARLATLAQGPLSHLALVAVIVNGELERNHHRAGHFALSIPHRRQTGRS
jgi:hypothetical protein